MSPSTPLVKESLMPRTATTFGAAALVALLLAGCTTPDPTPTDPGSTAQAPSSPAPSATESSPAASPTPVVIAPERPAAMDDEGYQGAEAAAKYFLSLDDYMMKTGDTAEWEAMSHKKCTFCAERLEQARTIADEGQNWSGGENAVQILHTYEQDRPTGIWPIDIEVTVEPTRVTDPSGKETYVSDEVVAERRLEVVHRGDEWKVVDLFAMPESPEEQ
ncbi:MULTISPECIES: DUF6318 family protein [Isoptericola]|uniref:DUF6318 family protein n=1 Tax=Isoptericola TaxID=254250 RepID=UPI00383BDAFD